MRSAKIPLVVRSIRPHSVYQNRVYTQLVEVSAQSKDFIVLDDSLLISDKHIGHELELELTTFSMDRNLEQLGTQKGIEIDQDMDAVKFLGKAIEVNIEKRKFLLDVGIGTILCDGTDIEGRATKVNVGDYVVHNPRRIDVESIYS